jgi:trans-aconitate methyltransferase
MNNWQIIWERKTENATASSILSRLLAVDGYDTLGAVTPEAWTHYVSQIAAKLNLQTGESVFDVGCGAGAFLWPLWQKGYQVGGMDYSMNQIERARKAMPKIVDFEAGEAQSLKIDPLYDHVVACGTFLYFPGLDYAEKVLNRMSAKARKSVAILDLPDLAKKQEILRQRGATLGEEAYQQRYAGLDHLYYAKTWFTEILEKLGLTCTIENQTLGGYSHSPYRFNILAHKSPNFAQR